MDVYNKDIETSKTALTAERKDRQILQTKRDIVTKESNEFKGEYGRYMATMSKKVTEGKAEHVKLTEYVSRTETLQALITSGWGSSILSSRMPMSRNIWIKPLKESNLGMVRALFDP